MAKRINRCLEARIQNRSVSPTRKRIFATAQLPRSQLCAGHPRVQAATTTEYGHRADLYVYLRDYRFERQIDCTRVFRLGHQRRFGARGLQRGRLNRGY